MALHDQVLKDFFDRTKKPLSTITEKNTKKFQFNHYRVFDDPIFEKNKIIVEASTGLEQSQNKAEDQPKNLGQTRDKLRTNLGQNGDKYKTNIGQKNQGEKEISDKHKTEPRTKLETNLGQTKDIAPTIYNFSSLVGLQRKITLFIYNVCNFSRSKVTYPLSIEHIANTTQTTKLSAQKTIQRLEIKRIISRHSFKNGRGGWTKYEIPDFIFQEITQEETQSKLRTNIGQYQDNPRTEPRTEPRTAVPSSSSFLSKDSKETTTSIPEEFQEIDITALLPYGFTEKHLLQIIDRSDFDKEMIQDSIDAFAFDLRRNNLKAKLKTTPLRYFMGIVTRGTHYNPPENYETPQQESRRLYLESKKIEKEREKKLQEEEFEFAFGSWEKTLKPEEKEAIIDDLLKDEPRMKNIIVVREGKLKDYYRKNILQGN